MLQMSRMPVLTNQAARTAINAVPTFDTVGASSDAGPEVGRLFDANDGVSVSVIGIGLLAPGLADWAGGQLLLREPAAWLDGEVAVPPPQRLPATERRRAGNIVKASLLAADQALLGSGVDAAGLTTVFSSSCGDPSNCHQLCEALATPERLVSPTRFTNSVHNAPAGYWHIAAASRAASTSLAALDASFAAGLQEAAVQCAHGQQNVLLVVCDVPYVQPLLALRPMRDVFAVALLLAPNEVSGGRALHIDMAGDASITACGHAGLDDLRQRTPAARALPFLQALAGSTAASVVVQGLCGQSLRVTVAAA